MTRVKKAVSFNYLPLAIMGLSPTLSSPNLAVIYAVLFAGWTEERRLLLTHHYLSLEESSQSYETHKVRPQRRLSGTYHAFCHISSLH